LFNTGDYYITNGVVDSDGKRIVKMIKNHSGYLDISEVPDGNIYIHFIDDKTGVDIESDEEYYENYLDRYKIAAIQNRFMTPSVIPIDIAGKVTIDKKASKSIVQSNINTLLSDSLKLGNLGFGEPMLKSYVESLIYSVSGVKRANLTYIGEDYTDSTTNAAYSEDGGVLADFDEVLVIADDYYESEVQKHGIILEYTNVY
jgi:hypothetical protein